MGTEVGNGSAVSSIRPGGEGTKRYVSEEDHFNEVLRHDRTRAWLSWITVAAVVLVLAVSGLTWMLIRQNSANRGLSTKLAKLESALSTKANRDEVVELVNSAQAGVNALQQDVSTLKGDVAFVRSKVNLVEGRMDVQDFATRDFVTQALGETEGRLNQRLTMRQQSMNDTLTAVRSEVRHFAESLEQQERSLQLFRTSVAADLTSVRNWQRASFGLGVVNGIVTTVHIKSDRHR